MINIQDVNLVPADNQAGKWTREENRKFSIWRSFVGMTWWCVLQFKRYRTFY